MTQSRFGDSKLPLKFINHVKITYIFFTARAVTGAVLSGPVPGHQPPIFSIVSGPVTIETSGTGPLRTATHRSGNRPCPEKIASFTVIKLITN